MRGAWFLLSAAEKGNAIAQNRLARLYAFGVVFEKHLPTAAKWHLIARGAGASDLELDFLIAKLTSEQRAEAEDEAQAWRDRAAAFY